MTEVGSAIDIFLIILSTLGQIQLARNFKDDFEACQLKLDVLQLRLTRWKEVIDLPNDNELDKTEAGDDKAQPRGIKDVFHDIEDCLSRFRRKSTIDKDGLTVENQEELNPETNLASDIKRIRSRLMQSIRKRQSQASTAIKSLKWVFYKKEAFDQFIGSMTKLLDELEKISPGDDNEQLYELSEKECCGINDDNLMTLKDIIEGCDPWLLAAVDKQLQGSKSSTQNIYQSHNEGFTIGNQNGNNNGISSGKGGSQTNHFSREGRADMQSTH